MAGFTGNMTLLKCKIINVLPNLNMKKKHVASDFDGRYW